MFQMLVEKQKFNIPFQILWVLVDIMQQLYLRSGLEVVKMDYEAIKDLIKTASEQELTYLNVESEGMHIIMKKGSQEIDTRVEDNVATSKISDTNEIIKEDKPIIEKK